MKRFFFFSNKMIALYILRWEKFLSKNAKFCFSNEQDFNIIYAHSVKFNFEGRNCLKFWIHFEANN